MRIFPWLATWWCLLLLGAGARAQAPAPPSPRPTSPVAASPDPQRQRVIGSIKELMQGIVDPSSDVLFDAVSYDITVAGVVETRPRTDEEWRVVRQNALLLAEVTNLLKMPGRRVAPATPILGSANEPPGPEDLTPAEIQALIDHDRPSFNRLAQGLADAALVALRATDARSADDLFAAGEEIDKACENCHLRYWYPKDKRPQPANLSQRKK